MATLANALRKDKVKHVSDENGWGEIWRWYCLYSYQRI